MNEYVRLVEFSTLNAHLHFSLKPELNNDNGAKNVWCVARNVKNTLTYIVYHQDAVRHLHFLSFAEEGNSSCRNVQHSVNFLHIFFLFFNDNGVKTMIICLLVFYLLRATIATVTYLLKYISRWNPPKARRNPQTNTTYPIKRRRSYLRVLTKRMTVILFKNHKMYIRIKLCWVVERSHLTTGCHSSALTKTLDCYNTIKQYHTEIFYLAW